MYIILNLSYASFFYRYDTLSLYFNLPFIFIPFSKCFNSNAIFVRAVFCYGQFPSWTFTLFIIFPVADTGSISHQCDQTFLILNCHPEIKLSGRGEGTTTSETLPASVSGCHITLRFQGCQCSFPGPFQTVPVLFPVSPKCPSAEPLSRDCSAAGSPRRALGLPEMTSGRWGPSRQRQLVTYS